MLECKFTDGGELTIQSEMSHLEQVSVKMETLLEKLLGYVEKVVKGEIEGDRKIGRYLLEALSKVPTIAPEQFEALLNNNMQDLLMVLYLSNLTKIQLTLGEQLSLLIA